MTELKIAAVQTSPVFGEVRANVDAALALVPGGMDLVVLPELFDTGYQFRDTDELARFAQPLRGEPLPGSTLARLVDEAAHTGATFVAGLAERDGDRFFNAAVLVRPDGTRGLYRKVHLFRDEKSLFSPGDLGFPVFAACGTTVGMMICFDWIFPEAARSLALAGAEVLCHPSNLLLPWCQDAMVTRCQENMVAAVTANRVGTENRTGTELTFSGRSQVTGRLGERLATLDAAGTGAATATVRIVEKDKLFTPRNDLWADRRPEAYRT
jgi:predicted amidohydrolase